jgi:O-antigen/teichoic acid export membrane protein
MNRSEQDAGARLSVAAVIRQRLAASRSAKAVLGVAAAWTRVGAAALIGLACTPLILRWLGQERYGAVKLAEQWFAYLELLTFGLGPAVSVLIIKAASTGTAADVAAYTRAGFRLLARQLRWVFPAAVVLAVAFPFVFDLSPAVRVEYLWALPAILAAVCLLPCGAFRYAVEAQQRGYIFQFGLTTQVVVGTGLAVAFAAAGFGLVGQMWAGLAGTAALYALLAYSTGALGRAFWAVPPALVAPRAVWHLQWPLLLVGVGNQLNILSDNLLVGALFGVTEVAAFALTRALMQMLTTFAGSVSGIGSWAGLVDLRARVGPEAFAARVAEASKLNLGVVLLVLAPVVGYNARFVGLWVGDHNYAGDLVTAATYAQIAVFQFFCLFAALIDLLGATRKRVWVSTAGTALKLALVIPLTARFGLAGLPLATALAYLCTDAWFCPRVLCRDYGVSGRRIAAGLARAVAVGGGWAGVCYLAGTRPALVWPGWAGLVAEMAVLEIGGVVIGWALLLSPADRAAWRARVRGWLGRPAAGGPAGGGA